MSSERDKRYEEIMRRIAERRAEQAAAPKREAQDELARVLDAVDAWGKLNKIKTAKGLRGNVFGPKALRGLIPQTWVAVVVWRKGSGYYGYKHLEVFGVWALEQDGGALLTVGSRRLSYTAPTYEAEAYAKLIKRNFDLYYSDDITPPPEGTCLYSTPYQPERRLDIREELREAVSNWASHS